MRDQDDVTLPDEATRQRALDRLRVVDSLPESAYDDVVRVAAAVCGTPIALVSLVDRDRQWFKARIGVDAEETTRDIAVCDHAIRAPESLFEVADLAEDPRFADNPLVTGDMGARFYAGMPLVTPEGAPIGTVCVLDNSPRALSEDQREALKALARITMALLEGRGQAHSQAVAEVLHAAVGNAPAAGPDAGYTVAILEIQDLAGAAVRLGERALDKALSQLDQQLATALRSDHGDTLDRVTGSGEFITVLQGRDTQQALAQLREQAIDQAARVGLTLLVGAADAASADESPDRVFLRADAALSAAKDATRPLRDAA
ncbi:GGDEF domain-containing protein, diguanylate cyclase (c-di-GMP synthetase) or its enzymatically inactive variants [Pseudoxanthomonas sp. GM95]|uniref:GAF domain-containing protein n=1 Tax=Pseudoxanthomonas sp. GM95 TaxID=1881043 RepID=UPI0008AF0C61|nr:GAF domain-containing protein [Pseudoxanthomonas sp. GM95]SEM09434.1 GGDEF domain-containing protein, diguanylate cyclase (c-di-GMP synthetase) or its enzymatically inactive variants [Pseudoxanthomonas sp. GM95]